MTIAATSSILNILLIDDDEDDYTITRLLMEEGLGRNFKLEWLRDFNSGLAALSENRHDIVLVDFRLGPDSGLELITEASRRGLTTPVILLTGQGDDTLDASAIELGASDYLVKGLVDAQSLARSIRYTLDRAHATERLSLSEARYRLLFEENPEPLVVVEPVDQRILSINAAALRLYGLSSRQVSEHALFLTDLQPSPEESRQLLAGVDTQSFDAMPGSTLTVHRKHDATAFFAEVTTNDIALDRKPAHLLMVVDVSAKIHALQRADQNEAALLRLLQDLRDATLVVDDDGTVHFANHSAAQLLEFNHQQTPSFRVAIPALPEGEPQVQQLQVDDDRFVWVEIQSSVTHWQGRPMRLLSMRDVSERVASDERLHLLQRGIEVASNGISIADATQPDCPLIYVNPAFEQITGYPAEEILGRNCRFLQGWETDQPGILDIRKAMQDQTSCRIVLKNFRKDGSPFWNDFFIAPVPNEAGQVTHFIGIQNDISDIKNAETALAFTASHDALTGLPNRSLLEDRLRQGWAFARRNKTELAVLFVDLDHFKLINDSLGHDTGDVLLIEVANRIRSALRASDTVARIGGDEFVVVLPDLKYGADAVKVADAILATISDKYETLEQTLHLTASIGISLNSNEISSAVELIQQADLAMYQAKQLGRNAYQWYSSEMNIDANHRMVLRNELQKAIAHEDLRVHYQPLFDSRTGQVVGVEALVRWMHAEKGLIAPNEFLPIAEDTGQIVQIGRLVLTQACKDIQRLHQLNAKNYVLAVNVSPVQVRQGNFIETVTTALEASHLAPALLELEIVESVMLQDTLHVTKTLNQLKELGVGISIDDFGTGFSSLNYIKHLPATKLKIDRSFIQDCIRNRNDAAITKGVISMAHHIGLTVVAEGVETEAQASFLRKAGCDTLQGFLFSKPLPFDELVDFLKVEHQKSLSPGANRAGVEDTKNARTLLLLDDEENILKALSRTLRRDGYRILTATTAERAFELLAENEVQVIISDQRMPEISGTEFLSQVKTIHPDTVRIVLSGYTDLKSVTEAINQGAIYKFLTKPWDDDQIRKHIAQAFLRFAAATDTNRT